MNGIGDGIIFLASIVSLFIGVYIVFAKRSPLYFKLILGAIFCLALSYLYDVCEYYTLDGRLSEGFNIGYLGTLGCFLFFFTASFGYMDGILDDRTAAMKKSRRLGLIAPISVLLLLLPNFFAEVTLETKICYSLVWLPALPSSYFNLKHAIIPDMDFGFVKAIRPFNVSAFVFTLVLLLHLTLSSFFSGIALIFSGIAVGILVVLLTVLAGRGVKKWII